MKLLGNFIKYGWGSILISCIIFYLCCLVKGNDLPNSQIPNLDKAVHFFMYFGLSLVASVQYIYIKKGNISTFKLIIFALIVPIIYGGLIEILQEKYFNRSGDWFDLLADGLGSILAIGFALWFNKRVLKLVKHE